MADTTGFKHYIGFDSVQATPMTYSEYFDYRGWEMASDVGSPDNPGYGVAYADGHQSWSEKAFFEATYFGLSAPEGGKIAVEDVLAFITSSEVIYQTARTTVCKFTLANGYEFIESSSCVSPENYSLSIGIDNCRKQAVNKVWGLLGFLLRTAKFGIEATKS